ncbi:MAG: glycosyltransferase [Acidobacteriota bacterium]|nr:glycosyltransferase [Acidobacteriota bacterium]
MLSYAVHLHQSGHDVTVVLLYSPTSDDPYLRRMREVGIPVSCIISRSFFFAMMRVLRNLLSAVFIFLFLLKGVPERLGKFWQVALDLISRRHYRDCVSYFAATRPDLLHVFTPDTGAALMIRAGHGLGIPVLYHELGTPYHMPMLKNYYRRLEKVLPFCDEVAALSPQLAADWSRRLRFLESVSVLPLIIESCNPLNLGPQIRSNEIVFGFAARLEQGKGPLVLLNALARLNRERFLGIARIAGVGPQLLEVKARARQLELGEACEFVGYYTDTLGRSSFLSSLDVFVLPSLAEGTPNSIIEAMTHGLPIIASAVGGIPDLLSEESGILVPPGDDVALAQAMERLASDPDLRARMGRAARERYLDLFSPEAVLPVLRNTYLRLASRTPPATASAERVAHPWEVAPEF